MEIYVYKGDFGLPSIDFDCLRVLAYIKFSGANVEIVENSNPFNSPNGFLPYLRDGSEKRAGYEDIIKYLKQKNFILNETVENIEGYIFYLRENLFPFFSYLQFGDPSNLEIIRSLYATRIPFPFNFIYPRKYVQKCNQLTETLANFSLEDPLEHHNTNEMSIKAKTCLNWIGEKLGNKEFMFEGSPTELDCALYGYLALILKETLPTNNLQPHAKQNESLIRYTDCITKKYFKPNERFDSSNPSGANTPNSEQSKTFSGRQDDDDEDPKELRKRYLLSGIVASCSMVAFAVYQNLFNV